MFSSIPEYQNENGGGITPLATNHNITGGFMAGFMSDFNPKLKPAHLDPRSGIKTAGNSSKRV